MCQCEFVAAADAPGVVSGVAAAALPVLARQSLRLIGDLTSTFCPELPPLWVVAQVQAESGWDAGLHTDQLPAASTISQARWPDPQ